MHHDIQLFAEYAVTPFVGVWIETAKVLKTRNSQKSHPSWVCGLKPSRLKNGKAAAWSHPSWVCGLKREKNGSSNYEWQVTPFVGVWIETMRV